MAIKHTPLKLYGQRRGHALVSKILVPNGPRFVHRWHTKTSPTLLGMATHGFCVNHSPLMHQLPRADRSAYLSCCLGNGLVARAQHQIVYGVRPASEARPVLNADIFGVGIGWRLALAFLICAKRDAYTLRQVVGCQARLAGQEASRFWGIEGKAAVQRVMYLGYLLAQHCIGTQQKAHCI